MNQTKFDKLSELDKETFTNLMINFSLKTTIFKNGIPPT